MDNRRIATHWIAVVFIALLSLTVANSLFAQAAHPVSDGAPTASPVSPSDCAKPYRNETRTSLCIAQESAQAARVAETLSVFGLILMVAIGALSLWMAARSKPARRPWMTVDWPNGTRERTAATAGLGHLDGFKAEITYRNAGLSPALKVRAAISQVTVRRGGAPVAEIVAVDEHALFAPGQTVVHSAWLRGNEIEAFLGGALDWYLLVELHYFDAPTMKQNQVFEASYRALLSTDRSGEAGIRFHAEGSGALQ